MYDQATKAFLQADPKYSSIIKQCDFNYITHAGTRTNVSLLMCHPV